MKIIGNGGGGGGAGRRGTRTQNRNVNLGTAAGRRGFANALNPRGRFRTPRARRR